MATRQLVIYSGGMDSQTLLHSVVNSIYAPHDPHYLIRALSFNYRQRHIIELLYAKAECARLNVVHEVVPFPQLGALGGSSLTSSDIDVPEGHYAAPSMKQTIVPGRNTVMLAFAMAYAEAWLVKDKNDNDHVNVYFGAHAGDHHIYPDCRPGFVEQMQGVFNSATEGRISLHAPFIHMSKGQIAKAGKSLNVNYGNSWTCYNGREKACGVCGSCTERLEALAEAGIADPLKYEQLG